MHDPGDANGYEAAADAYVQQRGATIGLATVLAWAAGLEAGAAVLDVGCGHGVPIAAALVGAGFAVHGVDASARMIEAFRARLPGVPAACETIESSALFDRRFDGVVAWGLVFLLPPATQRVAVAKMAAAVAPGGRLLFTAPAEAASWIDVITQRTSCSLGAEAYRALIGDAGLELVGEVDDEGENHYFSAIRPPVGW
jgi:SAM-dependent methyltransferase